MTPGMWSFFYSVAIFIGVLATVPIVWQTIQSKNSVNTPERLSKILDAMLKIEESYKVDDVRIAVGYGGCQDLFVPSSEILGKEIPPQKVHHYVEIDSMSKLKEAYAMFFKAGSAAERFISNKNLFEDLVGRAENSSLSHQALGGNAPVMASRFAKEGASVLLAMNPDPSLLAEIPPEIKVAGKPVDNVKDDIHLIFEYEKGEVWGPYTSPRANRFIVHSDVSNPLIESAEKFGEELEMFNPHLLVVGGLQMLDNFPFKKGERTRNLLKVHKQIKKQSPSTKVHFEMASFTELELLTDLKNLVIPYSDSLGMNEQELPILFNLLKYNNVSLVAQQNPRVAHVLDQMREIFSILGVDSSSRPDEAPGLTRLHVHTLAFQAIMVDRRSSWKHNMAAATKAALVAHRHVCHRKQVKVKYSNLLMDESFSLSTHPATGRIMFNDLNPVSCWTEKNFEICISPVLVCTKVKQTAGGGDNISAAGLVLQV